MDPLVARSEPGSQYRRMEMRNPTGTWIQPLIPIFGITGFLRSISCIVGPNFEPLCPNFWDQSPYQLCEYASCQ